MEKTFKYKTAYVVVKTNIIKAGQCYFGEKNIASEIERSYKLAQYHIPLHLKEVFVMDMWQNLLDKNIKPVSITMEDITYKGTKMSNFDQQTTLKEKGE